MLDDSKKVHIVVLLLSNQHKIDQDSYLFETKVHKQPLKV